VDRAGTVAIVDAACNEGVWLRHPSELCALSSSVAEKNENEKISEKKKRETDGKKKVKRKRQWTGVSSLRFSTEFTPLMFCVGLMLNIFYQTYYII